MNPSDKEGVETQLDRLNSALNYMLNSVRCETPGHGLHSRISIVPSELWNEDSLSSTSQSFDIQALQDRIESLLQENDRLAMLLEDSLSFIQRNQSKHSLSIPEIDQIISSFSAAKSGRRAFVFLPPHCFELSLQSDSFIFSQKTSEKDLIFKLENELEELRQKLLPSSLDNLETCPTCGIDPVSFKKELNIELNADFLKKKNEAVERERQNLESQFEELEQLKSFYQKKTREAENKSKFLEKTQKDLEKRELELASRRSQFEKKKHDWENKVLYANQQDLHRESGFSSNKYTQEELEQQLRELKEKLQDHPDTKIQMRVSQIETQLTRIRTEKLLNECSGKTSKVMNNLVKAFDKESNQDENKRKKLLDRTQLKYSGRERRKEDSGRFERKWEMLLVKEKELIEYEKRLQENWMQIPNAENLISVIQATYSHLNQQKSDNQINLLTLDKERSDLRKVFDKFLDIVGGVDNNKFDKDSIDKIKEYLNSTKSFTQ